MNRNIVTRLLVVAGQGLIQSLDIIVQTRPRDTANRHHANRIFVAELNGRLGIERQVVGREGYGAHLNLPQLAELLPYDLIGRTHHQIGLIARLTLLLATLSPAQPGRHTAQHTGFGRTDTQRATLPIRLFGAVPKVGQNVDASSAHDGHTRILRLVDIVYRDGLVHQARRLFVHVGRDEGGQVQLRTGLGIGLILDHAVGHLRRCSLLGNRIDGGSMVHRLRGVDVGCEVVVFFHRFVDLIGELLQLRQKPYQKRKKSPARHLFAS